MDTSNWTTRCVGRFLIDLPPSAVLTKREGQIWGKKVIWRKDLVPESAMAEARAKIEELKKTSLQERPVECMFLETFSLPNGGIGILRWDAPFSTAVVALECYFVVLEPHPRIFTFTIEADPDQREGAKGDMMYLASTLRSRNDWDPVPTEPGFCFEGGMSAHTGEWRAERAYIHFTLPQFPNITTAFALWGSGIVDKPLFENLTVHRARLLEEWRTLRKDEFTLGEVTAQEICLIQDDPDPREIRYDFILQAPSQGENLTEPQITLYMHTWYPTPMELAKMKRPRQKGISFTSDKEALGLWDAISHSIRLRPGAV